MLTFRKLGWVVVVVSLALTVVLLAGATKISNGDLSPKGVYFLLAWWFIILMMMALVNPRLAQVIVLVGGLAFAVGFVLRWPLKDGTWYFLCLLYPSGYEVAEPLVLAQDETFVQSIDLQLKMRLIWGVFTAAAVYAGTGIVTVLLADLWHKSRKAKLQGVVGPGGCALEVDDERSDEESQPGHEEQIDFEKAFARASGGTPPGADPSEDDDASPTPPPDDTDRAIQDLRDAAQGHPAASEEPPPGQPPQ